MTIKRTKIEEVVKALSPLLDSKGILAEKDCFIFSEGGVYCYNEKIGIKLPLEGCDFYCLVPSDPFMKIITKMGGKELTFEYAEGILLDPVFYLFVQLA